MGWAASHRLTTLRKTLGAADSHLLVNTQRQCHTTSIVDDIAMELKNAFSTSIEAFLPSKNIMYSITVASHGIRILPSLLTKPNSSWHIRRSSLKVIVPRHANGSPISCVT